MVLKLRVTEPPEDGNANAALVRLLAKSRGLPKSTLSLVAGHTDRRTTLAVAGDPPALRRALERWPAGLDPCAAPSARPRPRRSGELAPPARSIGARSLTSNAANRTAADNA